MKQYKNLDILKLKKTSDSFANKIFLEIKYQGGDADYYTIEVIPLKMLFENNNNGKLVLDEYAICVINNYKILEEILDGYTEYDDDELDTLYGEGFSYVYHDVPNDKVHYGVKCTIEHIILRAYDSQCNTWEIKL